MPKENPLPVDGSFANADEYVESLLSFVTSSGLFQNLCGGVHILDFLTREPDLYESIVQKDWRDWFHLHDISAILDLFMRESIHDLKQLQSTVEQGEQSGHQKCTWRGRPSPPLSLLSYILEIRKHCLDRTFPSQNDKTSDSRATFDALPRHVAVGMKPKKVHEVQNFVRYIDGLVSDIAHSSACEITHVVDFGSGQNYLGRALASPPYNKNVIALESKELNITGAKTKDITAKLAGKEKILRNKKQYRQGLSEGGSVGRIDSIPKTDPSTILSGSVFGPEPQNIQYMQHHIVDGDLSNVVQLMKPNGRVYGNSQPQLMVISLHSCGNLIHHGLRSLILNDSVKCVAMVGCCYNLMTEREGPQTYKLPTLRMPNRRLEQTSSAWDPHGFPMSHRLSTHKHQDGEGIRLNITARMMAVQAPQNWTDADCESFFTRHFYRALLQRILLDRGLIQKPSDISADTAAGSPRGWSGAGPAITIGSLRKTCYTSFLAYVRGAMAKIANEESAGSQIHENLRNLSDDDIVRYEKLYESKNKELSIIWSLMAFSAGVVESLIVVDRWLYLREQPQVKDCWVEAVFEYCQSPRNLVVVGIRR